jgi:hypothetical protein
VRAVLAAVVLLAAAGGAHAHQPSPEDVIARLRSPAARDAYGIVAVERHRELPRMLLVRVDERWRALPPERRRHAAEDWSRGWRHSVAQGIVSIVDAADGHAVVNFDGRGNALLAP